MSRSFNELGGVLKNIIIDMNSDAHNRDKFKIDRYANMKIEMNLEENPDPHVIIHIGISKAMYSLETLERIDGSLGPDERYITRWFMKMGVVPSLQALWKEIKDADKEQMDLRKSEQQN